MTDWSPPNKEYPLPKTGEPPLHCAARRGDHDEIRRLVASGADINAVFAMGLDPDAWQRPATPLMVAAGSGDGATESTVRLLLELGADPAILLHDASALTFAFEGLGWSYKPGGDAARAALLLEAGSPLPVSQENRNRLVCEVAASGDTERLSLLLAQGLSAQGYWDAETAGQRHNCVMQSMESHESEPSLLAMMPEELRETFEDLARKMMQETFERASSAPMSFEIPLFRAAESGSAECVRTLLEAGADPKSRDSSLCTALFYANSAAVVRVLLEAGLSLEDTNQFGWSPLVSSLSGGESDLPRIRALIEAGADVNAAHDHGYTVFMSAVSSMERHPEILRLLVASGADPHAVSERGYNAFHAAVDVCGEANAEESVRDTLGYLKELGVNIEQRNKSDQTPLARALQEGTGLEVRVLCELGANPNAHGPFHECGNEECTRINLPLLFHAADGVGVDRDVKTEALLKAGADPLVKDANGLTPLARVAASLCAGAADPRATFRAFFDGLRMLRMGSNTVPPGRDAYVAEAARVSREYVERFASEIPIPKTCEYEEQWRVEKLACIAQLHAYEAWWHRERLGRETAD